MMGGRELQNVYTLRITYRPSCGRLQGVSVALHQS